MNDETAKYTESQNDPAGYRGEGQALDHNHPTNESGEFQHVILDDTLENRDLDHEISAQLRRFEFVGSDFEPAVNIDYKEDGTITFSDEDNQANLELTVAQERLAGLSDDVNNEEFWKTLRKPLDISEI